MTQPAPWSVIAHNTASRSQNKIHDDDVARRYGFGGGLVPGVDDYAYLAHVPAELWGPEWLERGSMSARFHEPVYDGQRIEVRPGPVERRDGQERLDLELVGPDGAVCATGRAAIDLAPAEPPPPRTAAPIGPLPEHPPAATPESLAVGTNLTLPLRPFDADAHATYVAEVRETLPVYAAERVAHPGWVLRRANRVLSSNVTMGPWIHVSSDAQHHRLVRHGDQVGARAVVRAEWERKGHRFVTLDVEIVVAEGAEEVVAASIVHTAIYQPRQR
jgi:acyl dehydratase